jgi:hypothetical protein
MKRSGEKSKIIAELIDRLDQFREDLFTIQRRLENLENRERTDGAGESVARSRMPVNDESLGKEIPKRLSRKR